MVRRVLAVGVFDLLHLGHVHYLTEAAKLGDELVVVVATDRSVRGRKHEPVLPQEMRCALVAALKPVTRAVVGHEEDHYLTVEEQRPNVIALGYDDYHRVEEVKSELRKRGMGDIEVVRVPKFENDLGGSRRIIRRILDLYQTPPEVGSTAPATTAASAPAPTSAAAPAKPKESAEKRPHDRAASLLLEFDPGPPMRPSHGPGLASDVVASPEKGA
ncbi:MAG: adenylyltransferase/cytidyltransferase family protein [Thermoplasmatota archaeon]